MLWRQHSREILETLLFQILFFLVALFHYQKFRYFQTRRSLSSDIFQLFYVKFPLREIFSSIYGIDADVKWSWVKTRARTLPRTSRIIRPSPCAESQQFSALSDRASWGFRPRRSKCNRPFRGMMFWVESSRASRGTTRMIVRSDWAKPTTFIAGTSRSLLHSFLHHLPSSKP